MPLEYLGCLRGNRLFWKLVVDPDETEDRPFDNCRVARLNKIFELSIVQPSWLPDELLSEQILWLLAE